MPTSLPSPTSCRQARVCSGQRMLLQEVVPASPPWMETPTNQRSTHSQHKRRNTVMSSSRRQGRVACSNKQPSPNQFCVAGLSTGRCVRGPTLDCAISNTTGNSLKCIQSVQRSKTTAVGNLDGRFGVRNHEQAFIKGHFYWLLGHLSSYTFFLP